MAKYPYLNPNTAINITPSNTVALSQPMVLYVGGAGNVKVQPAVGGSAVVFNNLDAGSYIPLKVNMVYVTSTTSSSIIGLY